MKNPWWTISCRKAGLLVEKKVQNEIAPVDRIKLAVHTSMCSFCRRYQQQSKVLESALKERVKAQKERAPERLKQKILSKIK